MANQPRWIDTPSDWYGTFAENVKRDNRYKKLPVITKDMLVWEPGRQETYEQGDGGQTVTRDIPGRWVLSPEAQQMLDQTDQDNNLNMGGQNSTVDWWFEGDEAGGPTGGGMRLKTDERQGSEFQYGFDQESGEFSPTSMNNKGWYTNNGDMNKKAAIAFASVIGGGLAANYFMTGNLLGNAGAAAGSAGTNAAANTLSSLAVGGAEAGGGALAAADAAAINAAGLTNAAAGTGAALGGTEMAIGAADGLANAGWGAEAAAAGAGPGGMAGGSWSTAGLTSAATATGAPLTAASGASSLGKALEVGKSIWDALDSPLGRTLVGGGLKLLGGIYADKKAQENYEKILERIDRNQNVSGLKVPKVRGMMSTVVSVPKFDAYKVGRG